MRAQRLDVHPDVLIRDRHHREVPGVGEAHARPRLAGDVHLWSTMAAATALAALPELDIGGGAPEDLREDLADQEPNPDEPPPVGVLAEADEAIPLAGRQAVGVGRPVADRGPSNHDGCTGHARTVGAPSVPAIDDSCALNPARIRGWQRHDPAVQAAAARLADVSELGLVRLAALASRPPTAAG